MKIDMITKRQTRRSSAIESFVNLAIGYGVNLVANFAIFPLFGWDLSLKDNLTIGVFYTLVSFARSYVIRRLFNRKQI